MTRARAAVTACLPLCAVAIARASQPATVASAGTVVGAMIPSATRLDVAACASFQPDRTDFGLVLPGASARSTLHCNVKFGSSDDTAQLRMRQSDALGGAMWMPTRSALDPDFDGPSGTGNGEVTQAIGANNNNGGSSALQDDGKIVMVDECYRGANFDFCAARFDADGTLDTTFDGLTGTANGRFLLSIGSSDDSARDVAILPDGDIVLVGECFSGVDTDFCAARLQPDGSLDSSFDRPSGIADGRFLIDIGDDDVGKGVDIDATGRIVLVGECGSGVNDEFCAVRLNSNGTLDVTFDELPPGNRATYPRIDILWTAQTTFLPARGARR